MQTISAALPLPKSVQQPRCFCAHSLSLPDRAVIALCKPVSSSASCIRLRCMCSTCFASALHYLLTNAGLQPCGQSMGLLRRFMESQLCGSHGEPMRTGLSKRVCRRSDPHTQMLPCYAAFSALSSCFAGKRRSHMSARALLTALINAFGLTVSESTG